MNFSDYIRELRLQGRMNQVELAEKASVTPSYLNKIEKGKESNISEAVLLRLASALNHDPYLLIVKSGKIPSDFKEIIINDTQTFNYLSKKAKRGEPYNGG